MWWLMANDCSNIVVYTRAEQTNRDVWDKRTRLTMQLAAVD